MSDPFLGEIKIVGFSFPPRGWATCDGQLLQISQYSALFSLYGTTYGGDGRTTFGLPDLRGRIAMHVGTGPGLTPVTWGQRGGAENENLTNPAQLPSHTHTAMATKTPGTSINPSGLVWAADSSAADKTYAAATSLVSMNAAAIGNTGGSAPFSIRNPFLGVYFVCALTGIFPSRN